MQVYKLMSACRLVDAGQYPRALAYVEAAARAVTREPRLYSCALVRALAALADRYPRPSSAGVSPPHPPDDEPQAPAVHVTLMTLI